jgi:hypothetical protein
MVVPSTREHRPAARHHLLQPVWDLTCYGITGKQLCWQSRLVQRRLSGIRTERQPFIWIPETRSLCLKESSWQVNQESLRYRT